MRYLKSPIFFCFLMFLALGVGKVGHAENLRSPWDSLPSTQVRNGSKCPVIPKLSADLTDSIHYIDNNKAAVDQLRSESYKKSVASYRRVAHLVVDLADQYRETGNVELAQCVSRLLSSMANDNALGGRLATPQAKYVRAWMLNAYATAWLKVRVALTDDKASESKILDWFDRLAKNTVNYNDGHKRRNNLRYWAGLAVMSTGIASNNQKLFDWGIASYDIGINEIAADGALPEEIKRGSRARGYHMFAAAPLVMMAELASANDIDLYQRNNRAIGRLVSFIIQSIDDPTIVTKQAGVSQRKIERKGSMAWFHIYAKRFPNTSYVSILRRFPETKQLYLGGQVP